MNFRLKEDWYIDDFFDKVKIYDTGHIFSPTEDGRYMLKGINDTEMYLRFDDMLYARSAEGELRFETINDRRSN